MNSDLWWLANNEPVWNEKHDRICIFSAGGTEFFNSKYFPGKEGFTKEEHKSARRRLGLDHPEIFPASTPEEDEAWAEAEKKLNPVWQSPHPIGGVCVFHGCRYAAYEPCPMCVLADKAAKEEGKQPTYDPDDVAFVHAGEGKQPRYQDTAGEDWIDEAARTFTPEEFRGAMRFSIGKYNRRMGKKDNLISEIEKIRDYATRWLEVEQGR